MLTQIWLLECGQTVMVHELFKLAQHLRAEKKLPGFRWCPVHICHEFYILQAVSIANSVISHVSIMRVGLCRKSPGLLVQYLDDYIV